VLPANTTRGARWLHLLQQTCWREELPCWAGLASLGCWDSVPAARLLNSRTSCLGSAAAEEPPVCLHNTWRCSPSSHLLHGGVAAWPGAYAPARTRVFSQLTYAVLLESHIRASLPRLYRHLPLCACACWRMRCAHLARGLAGYAANADTLGGGQDGAARAADAAALFFFFFFF